MAGTLGKRALGLSLSIIMLRMREKADIYEAVKHAFPEVLSEEKQYKKLSNLLQKMKNEGVVGVRGSAVHAEWFFL